MRILTITYCQIVAMLTLLSVAGVATAGTCQPTDLSMLLAKLYAPTLQTLVRSILS